MIDVRQAVVAAQDYFNSMLDLLNQDSLLVVSDVRLEEVEISEDKKYWLITFGYNLVSQLEFQKNRTAVALNKEVIKSKENRHYKILKVNTNNGEVESMRIRDL
jgi:hypothetical protein